MQIETREIQSQQDHFYSNLNNVYLVSLRVMLCATSVVMFAHVRGYKLVYHFLFQNCNLFSDSLFFTRCVCNLITSFFSVTLPVGSRFA